MHDLVFAVIDQFVELLSENIHHVQTVAVVLRNLGVLFVVGFLLLSRRLMVEELIQCERLKTVSHLLKFLILLLSPPDIVINFLFSR